jgi:hypothetical protein
MSGAVQILIFFLLLYSGNRREIDVEYLVIPNISMREYEAILDTVFIDGANQTWTNNKFKYLSKDLSCDQAKEQANEDINNKKLSYISYGLFDGGFNYYIPILKNRYGINSVYYGDVVNNWIFCYNEVMSEKIEQVYGENFWLEVDSLYNLLDKHLIKTDDGKITFLNRLPKYGNSETSFGVDFLNLLDDQKNYNEGKYFYYLTLSKTGHISELRGDKKLNRDDFTNSSYLEVLNMLDNWTPAYIGEDPIQTNLVLVVSKRNAP